MEIEKARLARILREMSRWEIAADDQAGTDELPAGEFEIPMADPSIDKQKGGRRRSSIRSS